MVSFLKNITLFCVFIFISLNLLILFRSDKEGLEIIAAKNQLIDTSSNQKLPRLLISGGSCGLFSINSDEIQTVTDLQVINTSIYAGIGYRLILEHTLENSRQNDSVLLIPEYTIFLNDLDGGRALCDFVYTKHSYLYDFTTWRQFYNLKSNYLSFLSTQMETIVHNPLYYYSEPDYPLEITSSGDLIFDDQIDGNHPSLTKSIAEIKVSRNLTKRKQHYIKVINLLNEYENKFKQKDVKFFILWPPILKEFYYFNNSELAKINNSLQNKNHVQSLTEFCGLVLNRKHFHDTPEHLNNYGKSIWFKKIKDKLIF